MCGLKKLVSGVSQKVGKCWQNGGGGDGPKTISPPVTRGELIFKWEISQLITHSPIYCIKEYGGNILHLRHTMDRIYLTHLIWQQGMQYTTAAAAAAAAKMIYHISIDYEFKKWIIIFIYPQYNVITYCMDTVMMSMEYTSKYHHPWHNTWTNIYSIMSNMQIDIINS